MLISFTPILTTTSANCNYHSRNTTFVYKTTNPEVQSYAIFFFRILFINAVESRSPPQNALKTGSVYK
jgi:hypothetical protein